MRRKRGSDIGRSIVRHWQTLNIFKEVTVKEAAEIRITHLCLMDDHIASFSQEQMDASRPGNNPCGAGRL